MRMAFGSIDGNGQKIQAGSGDWTVSRPLDGAGNPAEGAYNVDFNVAFAVAPTVVATCFNERAVVSISSNPPNTTGFSIRIVELNEENNQHMPLPKDASFSFIAVASASSND